MKKSVYTSLFVLFALIYTTEVQADFYVYLQNEKIKKISFKSSSSTETKKMVTINNDGTIIKADNVSSEIEDVIVYSNNQVAKPSYAIKDDYWCTKSLTLSGDSNADKIACRGSFLTTTAGSAAYSVMANTAAVISTFGLNVVSGTALIVKHFDKEKFDDIVKREVEPQAAKIQNLITFGKTKEVDVRSMVPNYTSNKALDYSKFWMDEEFAVNDIDNKINSIKAKIEVQAKIDESEIKKEAVIEEQRRNKEAKSRDERKQKEEKERIAAEKAAELEKKRIAAEIEKQRQEKILVCSNWKTKLEQLSGADKLSFYNKISKYNCESGGN